MHDYLIVSKPPPKNRWEDCHDDDEQHFPEAAVMIVYALYLIETHPSICQVNIHPGEHHAKCFSVKDCLEARGFEFIESRGSTTYGELHRRGQHIIAVYPPSGLGGVSCELNGRTIVAECNGGIINTKHAGQVSKLEGGLFEAVGRLLTISADQKIAVGPKTPHTEEIARRIFPRARQAGIEIALIDATGGVFHYH